MLDKTIKIRISEGELNQWKERASKGNQTISELIRGRMAVPTKSNVPTGIVPTKRDVPTNVYTDVPTKVKEIQAKVDGVKTKFQLEREGQERQGELNRNINFE